MIVIGVGNSWRGDDGAGPAVARRLRALVRDDIDVRELEADGTRLLGVWRGADLAVVVDASSSGAMPGTVHRFDALAAAPPARALRSSTHAFGVADAIALGEAVGQLPDRLLVYGIEGADFSAGGQLSPGVARAVEEVAREIAALDRVTE